MEVHFNAELQARLKRAPAAAAGAGGPDEYVQQLVEHYLGQDVWLRMKVKQGLEQLIGAIF